MTHEEWTDRLSDYLDDELTADERYAVESHLQGCADCTAVLDELKQVVARARTLEGRPPRADLWPGVAARIEAEGPATNAADGPGANVVRMPERPVRRFAFTLPQLAAASLLIAAMSGGLAWSLVGSRQSLVVARNADQPPAAHDERPATNDQGRTANDERPATNDQVLPVSFADAAYDAAVSDLERALKEGRGKLDPQTITIVEHNLQTIDEAIRQAREALGADRANSFLSSHLVEARRRKLDLLRRAAALTSESD